MEGSSRWTILGQLGSDEKFYSPNSHELIFLDFLFAVSTQCFLLQGVIFGLFCQFRR